MNSFFFKFIQSLWHQVDCCNTRLASTYFLFFILPNFWKIIGTQCLKFQEFKQSELNIRLTQSNALILNKLTERIIGGSFAFNN